MPLPLPGPAPSSRGSVYHIFINLYLSRSRPRNCTRCPPAPPSPAHTHTHTSLPPPRPSRPNHYISKTGEKASVSTLLLWMRGKKLVRGERAVLSYQNVCVIAYVGASMFENGCLCSQTCVLLRRANNIGKEYNSPPRSHVLFYANDLISSRVLAGLTVLL